VADSSESAQPAADTARLPGPRVLLRQTDWSMLDHAYGGADDIPRALTQLTDDDPEVRATALRHLERVNHQNTIYSATAPVAVYIAGVLGDPRTVPAVNANFAALPSIYRSALSTASHRPNFRRSSPGERRGRRSSTLSAST
jgi:hypothetical protein